MYGPEPRNLTTADVQRIVNDTLRASSSLGLYGPQSIPWAAVVKPDSGYNTQGVTGSIGWTTLSTAPTGALIADGSVVDGALYPALYAAYIADGSPYGVSGSDPLLPDLVDKFMAGAGSAYTLGDTGGAATVSLTSSQNGPHSHTTELQSVDQAGEPTYGLTVTAPFAGRPIVTYVSVGSKVSTNSSGSGSAHENLPPYVALTPFVWT